MCQYPKIQEIFTKSGEFWAYIEKTGFCFQYFTKIGKLRIIFLLTPIRVTKKVDFSQNKQVFWR